MKLQKIQRIMKRIFFFSPIPTLFISIPCFALVIWVLIDNKVNPAITYLAYVLSAYALIITVIAIVRAVKWGKAEFFEHPQVKKILGISYVDRFLKEKLYRAEISLYPGLLINFLYAGIKLFSGIRYHSFGTKLGVGRDHDSCSQ